MVGDQFGLRLGGLGEARLETIGDTQMQLLAPSAQ